MVEDLITCLRIYKNVINGGYISDDYKNRCEKIINEINTLNEMIKANQVLNEFDFISLKRNIAAVFHPDHFHGIEGIIDNPDDILAVFIGSLKKIEDCKKRGVEIKANISQTESEERKRTRRNQSNYESDYGYAQEDQVYTESQDTIFSYFANRFNALFKNIPSNEEDYINILEKFQKKIESYRNRLNAVEEEMESLRRSIRITENERYSKTSPESINEEYDKLCVRLYNTANILYGNLSKRRNLVNNRYYELQPIMHAKEDEFNASYSALTKEYNQLILDYNSAYYNGDKKQLKYLQKRLKEVEKELNENDEYINGNLAKTISDEVVSGDYTYRDLCEKYHKTKKRFEKADRNYKKVISNPQFQKEQIKSKYYRKYENILKTYTDELQYNERVKEKLEQGIEYYIEKIREFENIYAQYAPEYGRRKK